MCVLHVRVSSLAGLADVIQQEPAEDRDGDEGAT